MFSCIFISLLCSGRIDWFSIIAVPFLLHIQDLPPHPLSFFFFKVTMFLVKLLFGERRMKAALRRQFYFLAS